MKTLILYLDGLGFGCINQKNTPFLHSYGKKNSLLRLKTLLGYTGIENAFITGKMPNETGIWTEFVYKRNILGKILRFVPLPKSVLSNIYALMNYYLLNNTFLTKLHNIPRKSFGKFNSGVKDKIWKREYFQNKKFLYYGWPFFVINNKVNLDIFQRKEDFKVRKFIKSFSENIDVYFIHLVDLDKKLHYYGTNHEEVVKEIKKQDEYASLIVNEFERKFKDSKVIIWSDHGFIDIKGFINIKSIVNKFKNIDFFIDSTLARFWFKDNTPKENLIKELNSLKTGKIIGLKEKEFYNIPLGNEYGELIFAADPGYLMLPNFYQGNKPCKGMHGYSSEQTKKLDAFFIINRKIKKKELKMNEVLPYLENGSIRV